MRKQQMFSLIAVAILHAASSAQPAKYSVRDAGFVDLGQAPYRLLVIHDGATIRQAQHQETLLCGDLANSNLRLVQASGDEVQGQAENRAVRIPAQLGQSRLWLVSPDDRAAPFEPTRFMRELLHSPLRHAVQHEVIEGIEWLDDDLYHRIAALGQSCDREVDRRIFGPALPFAWSDAWRDKLPESLGFNPHSETVQREIVDLLQQTPFTTFTAMQQPPVEENERAEQDPLPPKQQDVAQHAEPKQAAFPPPTPLVIADQSVAIAFLIAGVAGWIMLTIAFMILLNRRTPEPKS